MGRLEQGLGILLVLIILLDEALAVSISAPTTSPAACRSLYCRRTRRPYSAYQR